jgi:hypothetical protein
LSSITKKIYINYTYSYIIFYFSLIIASPKSCFIVNSFSSIVKFPHFSCAHLSKLIKHLSTYSALSPDIKQTQTAVYLWFASHVITQSKLWFLVFSIPNVESIQYTAFLGFQIVLILLFLFNQYIFNKVNVVSWIKMSFTLFIIASIELLWWFRYYNWRYHCRERRGFIHLILN